MLMIKLLVVSERVEVFFRENRVVWGKNEVEKDLI